MEGSPLVARRRRPIALEADGALILNRKDVVEEADRLGLFIIGVKP